MSVNLLRCKENEFNKIVDFYKYVIANTQDMDKYGRWIYGQHPTDDMIKQYINDGYMYCIKDSSTIIATVALTPFQEDDYHLVNWSLNLNDAEVCVVHILSVSPDFQKRGIAKEIIEAVIGFAKNSGKRAVRLDALCCNEPAHKLYESMGFVKRDTKNWFAANTGWIDFYLYELVLD